MKKIKLYFVGLITMITMLSCGYGKPEKKAFELNGTFKKVTEIKFKIRKDSLGTPYKDTSQVTIYDLNDKGNLKLRKDFIYIDSVLRQTGITTYFYNFRNQIKRENYLAIEDSMTIKTHYLYKKSLLRKTYGTHQYEEFFLKYFEKYYYRPNRTLKESEDFMLVIDEEDSDTISLQKGVFEYDSIERLVKSIWTAQDTLGINKIETYEYDDTDLLVSSIEFDKLSHKNDTLYYEYVFDKNGNWIKRTELKNNEPNRITERIIE
jgi:hypothetical protein